MKLKRPQFIFFDLGHTLVKTHFNRLGWIDRWLELGHNTDGLEPETVRTAADVLLDATETSREQDYMEFTRAQIDRNLAFRLGVTFDLTDEEMDLEFVKAAYRQVPEPGLRTALEAFQAAEIRMGVLSNSGLGHRALEYVLEQHDLLKHFEFLMSSADYGFRKPHPQLFKTALTKSGSKPESIWFAGDSLECDVLGAQGVGMTGVWYNPEGLTSDGIVPRVQVPSWSEFQELVLAL